MTGRTLEKVIAEAMDMIIRHCTKMQIELLTHHAVIPDLEIYYNTHTHKITDHRRPGSKNSCLVAVCGYDWYMECQQYVEYLLAWQIYSKTPYWIRDDHTWYIGPADEMIRDALKRKDVTRDYFESDVEMVITYRLHSKLMCDYGEPLRETILDAEEGWPTYYDEDTEHVNPAGDWK